MKILATHEWVKRGGCKLLCEEVQETGNDLLVNTLPYASPTLQGMLPTTAHFSYFPAGSSLPCSVTINHRHATLCLFKKHSELYRNVKTRFNFLLVLHNNDPNAHMQYFPTGVDNKN
jgi:hypothetical protein